MSFRATSVLLGLLVVMALAGGATRPAFADPRDISVGGVFITRITHANGPYSDEQRAIEITRRITQILSAPEFRGGAAVTVRQSGADALVSVANFLVFTVTPADASGSGSTLSVAKQWASRLAQGLSKALPSSNFYF